MLFLRDGYLITNFSYSFLMATLTTGWGQEPPLVDKLNHIVVRLLRNKWVQKKVMVKMLHPLSALVNLVT
jgi:hypothetical protein